MRGLNLFPIAPRNRISIAPTATRQQLSTMESSHLRKGMRPKCI